MEELENKNLEEQKRVLMRTREVLDIFQIDKDTLTNWKKKQIITAIKVGGLDFYKADDVYALIDGGAK